MSWRVELGLFATAQVSVRLTDPRAAARAVNGLLTSTRPDARRLRVTGVTDLDHPTDGLPPTEGVRLQLDGGRIVVRPSGTEPKIKAYLEVVTPADVVAQDLAGARAAASRKARTDRR